MRRPGCGDSTSVLLCPRDHSPTSQLSTIHYGTPLSHFVPPCSTSDTKRGTPGVPFSGKVFHHPDRNGTLWNRMGQFTGKIDHFTPPRGAHACRADSGNRGPDSGLRRNDARGHLAAILVQRHAATRPCPRLRLFLERRRGAPYRGAAAMLPPSTVVTPAVLLVANAWCRNACATSSAVTSTPSRLPDM